MAVHPGMHVASSSSDPWPNGFPSPTLTNPEMILPFSDHRQSRTPSPPFQRTPSPPRMNAALNSHPPEPPFFATPLRKKTPPPRNLWQYSDHEPAEALSDIEEVESTPKSRRPSSRSRSPSPTSTPTLAFTEWQRNSQEPRIFSGDSGIGGNDDTGHWEDFDTVQEVGDVGDPALQSEYQDGPSDTEDDRTSTGSTEFDERSFRNSFTLGEDELSSAALSKRAERILANAKKRLTSMEGKLSEARDSLMPSPPPTKHEIPFSVSIGEFAAGRSITRSVSQATGERRVFRGSGQSPSPSQRHPPALNLRQSLDGNLGRRPASDLAPSATLAGFDSPDLLGDHTFGDGRIHLRRASTSQRNYIPLGSLKENEPDQRDNDVNASLFDRQAQGLGISDFTPTPGVSRSKSQSQMRDLRDQMNDLKGKISTLKARAKEDNIRRRSLQSLRTPSPFTSAAEQWYTSAVEYREGGLNTNAGYGWSPKKESAESPEQEYAQSPMKEEHEGGALFDPPADQIGVARGSLELKPAAALQLAAMDTQYDDAEEVPPTHEIGHREANDREENPILGQTREADDMLEEDPIIGQTGEADDMLEEKLENTQPLGEDEGEQYVGEEMEEGDEEDETDDEYLDTEPAPAERHEDRADAFDYEHFFLHSALGNYSRSSRRSRRGSVSSESSVETTRALTPSADQAPTTTPPGLATKRSISSIKSSILRTTRAHHRNDSVDSVSTFATFATATEGLDNDDQDDGADEMAFWKLENATAFVPAVPIPNDPHATIADKTTSWPPRTSSRGSSRSRSNSRANSIYISRPPRPLTAIQINGHPTPTNPKDGLLASDLSTATAAINATPSPQPTSTLVQALAAADSQRTLNFNEVDRELVEKLVESLGKVCVQMGHEASEEAYESKIWRRRLDTARRVLEGQVDLDQDGQTP